ncbi:MAG: NAD(P)-binding protein [Bdellovibrionaceae bacterium]|nr:NAD(P)-binding protein [Pseudobdellovibrionaceae bacterium]
MKIAVIGSGISGLVTAFLAQESGHEVHLFEKGNYFGGHSNTIEIDDGKSRFWADTGFLVHNPKTYPNLIQLLEILSVKTIESQMTLSVQILNENIEWGGTDLGTLFAQKLNLIRPKFYRMIFELLRFNRMAPQLLVGLQGDARKTLGELLTEHHFSQEVRDWYLVPMAAAVWSTPANKILDFPASTFLQFCMNHNLLQVDGRPTWRTIEGGSREYVRRIVDRIVHRYLNANILSVRRESGRVELKTAAGVFWFDRVVFASHADQTRKLLIDQDAQESEILASFNFQKIVPLYTQIQVCCHSDKSYGPLGITRPRKMPTKSA